jgi:hypothetical protein
VVPVGITHRDSWFHSLLSPVFGSFRLLVGVPLNIPIFIPGAHRAPEFMPQKIPSARCRRSSDLRWHADGTIVPVKSLRMKVGGEVGDALS